MFSPAHSDLSVEKGSEGPKPEGWEVAGGTNPDETWAVHEMRREGEWGNVLF